jgi:hypothetical protein
MESYELCDFLRLSGDINLQLNARGVRHQNILGILLNDCVVPSEDNEILRDVLKYLDMAYAMERRKLGPLAVLHPLRAAAVLARVSGKPVVLDLLTSLLHDKLEDIPFKNTTPQAAAEAEKYFHEMLEKIDPERQWYLMERLDWLTRKPTDTYYSYIGHLLDHAVQAPSLLRVKLADRLDNTLDMRVDVRDPIDGVDFFAIVFQLLYVNGFRGYRPQTKDHPDGSPMNGAKRLYQLFKNAELMSLIRKRNSELDATARRLFTLLARASMKEAERIVLHIFGYHINDLQMQRELLLDVMRYAQEGGLDRVTPPGAKHPLDGHFVSCFEDTNSKIREENLNRLYQDKPMMVRSALAFIVIFMNFMEDDNYFVAGIHEGGMEADTEPASRRATALHYPENKSVAQAR